jgi:hypothetical protein
MAAVSGPLVVKPEPFYPLRRADVLARTPANTGSFPAVDVQTPTPRGSRATRSEGALSSDNAHGEPILHLSLGSIDELAASRSCGFMLGFEVLMMNEMYDQTLQNMEKCHVVLAARVRQPTAVEFGDGHVFRYNEGDVHQALVQKLARVISGLHAARLLLVHGFLQELGALQRMLDEFNEDINFLASGVIAGKHNRVTS